MINEKLISKDLSLQSKSATIISDLSNTRSGTILPNTGILTNITTSKNIQIENELSSINTLVFTIQKNLLSAIEQQEELEKQAKQNQGNQSGVNIDNVFENVLMENKSLIDQVNESIKKFNKINTKSISSAQIDKINNIRVNFNIINLLIAHMQKVKILCIEDYINLMLNPYKYKFKKSYISEQPDTVKAISNGLLKIILLSLKSPEYVKTVQYKLTDSTNFTSVSSSQVETNCTEIVDNNTTVSTLVSQHNVASTLYKDTSTVNEKLDSSVYNKLVFNIQNIQLSIKDLNNKINEFQDNTLEEIVILGLGLLCDKIELQIKSIKEDFENNIANLNSEEINNIKLLLDDIANQKQELSDKINNLKQGDTSNVANNAKVKCDKKVVIDKSSIDISESSTEPDLLGKSSDMQEKAHCSYVNSEFFQHQLSANKININITKLVKFDNISSQIINITNYINKLQEEFINRINDKEYFVEKQNKSMKDDDYGILAHLSKSTNELERAVKQCKDLPILLQEYLFYCSENLTKQKKILRELIRHFNYPDEVLNLNNLLILQCSPEHYQFKARREDKKYTNNTSYEQATENKGIILELLHSKTVLEIETIINAIKNNTSEYFILDSQQVDNIKEVESKFNLLKEIQLDKIIDLIQIPENGSIEYREQLETLSDTIRKLINIKSQFKTLLLAELDDDTIQTFAQKLNMVTGRVTLKLGLFYDQDFSRFSLSPTQNEYIKELIHYIDLQWNIIKILLKDYQDFNPTNCNELLDLIHNPKITPNNRNRKYKTMCTNKKLSITDNKTLIHYKHKLMHYLLDNKESCIIENTLENIIFYYNLNSRPGDNLDQESIVKASYYRSQGIIVEKDKLYNQLLCDLNHIENQIHLISDLLADIIISNIKFESNEDTKSYEKLINSIYNSILDLNNTGKEILPIEAQYEIELLISKSIKKFTTISRISKSLLDLDNSIINQEDYAWLMHENQFRLNKLQQYRNSLELFTFPRINLLDFSQTNQEAIQESSVIQDSHNIHIVKPIVGEKRSRAKESKNMYRSCKNKDVKRLKY